MARRFSMRRLSTRMREGIFDATFHRITGFLKSKLAEFTSAEQCGRWNDTLLAAVRSDEEFRQDLSNLHEQATELAFPQEAPVTDGFEIVRVEIEFLAAITVTSRLWYFVCNERGTLGTSAAPSRFVLRRLNQSSATYTASFGLGLRDCNGEFCYPRTDRHNGNFDDPPARDSGWAFFRSYTYGEHSLLEWMRRKKAGG